MAKKKVVKKAPKKSPPITFEVLSTKRINIEFAMAEIEPTLVTMFELMGYASGVHFKISTATEAFVADIRLVSPVFNKIVFIIVVGWNGNGSISSANHMGFAHTLEESKEFLRIYQHAHMLLEILIKKIQGEL